MIKFKFWLFVKLVKSMGFPFIDIYAPGGDNIVAITVATDERYTNLTQEIQLLH